MRKEQTYFLATYQDEDWVVSKIKKKYARKKDAGKTLAGPKG